MLCAVLAHRSYLPSYRCQLSHGWPCRCTGRFGRSVTMPSCGRMCDRDRSSESPVRPRNEVVLACFCHASFFFGPVLVPVIIWIVAIRLRSAWVRRNAAVAFDFQLTFIAALVVLAPVANLISDRAPSSPLLLPSLAIPSIAAITTILLSIRRAFLMTVEASRGRIAGPRYVVNLLTRIGPLQ